MGKIEDLDSAIELDPTNSSLYLDRAYAKLDLGGINDALDDMVKAV